MEYIGIHKFYGISGKTSIYTTYYSINFLFYPLGRVCAYIQCIYSTLQIKAKSWRSTISSEAQQRWTLYTGAGVLHVTSEQEAPQLLRDGLAEQGTKRWCVHPHHLSRLTLSCDTTSSIPRDKDVPYSARCPCAPISALCNIQLADPAIKWHLYS